MLEWGKYNNKTRVKVRIELNIACEFSKYLTMCWHTALVLQWLTYWTNQLAFTSWLLVTEVLVKLFDWNHMVQTPIMVLWKERGLVVKVALVIRLNMSLPFVVNDLLLWTWDSVVKNLKAHSDYFHTHLEWVNWYIITYVVSFHYHII